MKEFKDGKKYHSKGYITLYCNPYIAKEKALYVLSASVKFSALLESTKDALVLDVDVERVELDFCEKCPCDLGEKDKFLSEDDKDFNDVMQMNNAEDDVEDENDFILSFLEDSADFKDFVSEAIMNSSLVEWSED